jgi:hypothetical protein
MQNTPVSISLPCVHYYINFFIPVCSKHNFLKKLFSKNGLGKVSDTRRYINNKMKQITFWVVTVLQLTTVMAFAQSDFKAVTFKEVMRPALQLQLGYEPKTAEQTILAKLNETGYKPEKTGGFLNKKNKQEGFYVFSGVELPELANQKLDLYFKVDAVNDNSGNRSSVTLMVSKGYENFVAKENDSATFAASEKFLNSFVNKTDMYATTSKLEDQKKSLAVSEKKWQALRDKQEEARKKIAQLEADLKNWQQEELAQQKDVDAQRLALKDLEAKRSSIQQ